MPSKHTPFTGELDDKQRRIPYEVVVRHMTGAELEAAHGDVSRLIDQRPDPNRRVDLDARLELLRDEFDAREAVRQAKDERKRKAVQADIDAWYREHDAAETGGAE